MEQKEEQDNVREPDPVKREKILDDGFGFDFEEDVVFEEQQFNDDDLDKALKESRNLYREKMELSENYQKQIMELYMEETRQRKEKFANLLLQIKKVAFYDPEVKEIYEILDPIIDSYVSQCVETVELDPITYDRIFHVIRSLKTESIEVLRSLLIREV